MAEVVELFKTWISNSQLPVKIVIDVETERLMAFHFESYVTAVRGFLFCDSQNNWQITVEAEAGDTTDYLINPEVDIKQRDDGWVCGICETDKLEPLNVFPTKQALVEEHLFDYLSIFIEQKLLPGRFIAFWVNDVEYADIVPDEPEDATLCIPLRLGD